VENVGDALFSEWKSELGEYKSAAMRRESERKLRDTRQRYDEVVAAMHKAESRIAPVLDALRDQTLFPQAQPQRTRDRLDAHGAGDDRERHGIVDTRDGVVDRAIDEFIRSMGIESGAQRAL
jgi:hypothetical protein